MPLTTFKGLGGSGKTTLAVWMVGKYWKDLRVFSNFPIDLPNVEQIDALELFDLETFSEPVVAVWDEGYTEAENRNAMSDENRVKTYIPMQARKNNLTLIIIEQIDIMDIRFRQLNESVIFCKKRKIYNSDYTFYRGDFHYTYVVGRRFRNFTLPYSEAEKVFPLFKTERKIFPKDFDELMRKAKLKDPVEKIKEVDRLADIIRDNINGKITHDIIKYQMLKVAKKENIMPDFSLEPYIYVMLKGE